MVYERRTFALFALLASLAVTTSSEARADDEATKLFNAAVEFMKQERCTEALPLLREAQRRDPGIGTQFNLAVCEEKTGRFGSAFRDYRAVLNLAHASGKRDREDAAREKLSALAPRLSRFSIRVAEADRDTVIVRVDDVVLSRDELDGYPVDPGSHPIDAIAPSKERWTATHVAPAEGQTETIKIPPLVRTTAGSPTKPVESSGALADASSSTATTRRTVGFVVGGIGVVGLLTGTATGIVLLNAKSTADERCTPRCVDASGALDQEGVDAVNRGKTLAPVNVVAWAIGIVGVGVGAFFLFTTPSASARAPHRTLAVGWNASGIEGTF
jgi:hypothetical protein